MNKGLMVGSLLSGTRNHKFTNYIKSARKMRVVGTGAVAAFLILSGMFVAPLYFRDVTRATVGTAKAADTTLTVKSASNKSSVALDVTSSDGTFAASTADNSAQFSVVTNNFTGYTLTITPGSTTQSNTLSTGAATFETLPSTVTASNFSTNSSLNGKWGYTFYKSGASATNYYPAGAANNKIEETSVANSTENIYYIGLGVRAGYGQAAGTYNNATSSNTYVVTATGNNISYKISFADNTSDATVSGLPSALSSATSTTSVTLPTTTPTRTGYTFAGWCLGTVSGGTTCTGTKYAAADVAAGKAAFGIDQTEDNSNITLYSYWTINQYDCVKRYRLQNADGSWGSYQTESTTKTNYNTTCSYSKTVTDYKPSASGTNSSQASASGTVTTSGATLSLDFYRNTYTLTVDRNTSYIGSASASTTAVHGTNYYRWGQSVSISATASSGNKFTTWSQTDPSSPTGTFGSTTSASTTFTMPKANTTIYANGTTDKLYMWNATSANCGTTMYDNRDGTERAYTTKKIGTLCWMTTNLALGASSTVKLTSATSNVSSSGYTLPASSTSGFSSYTAQNVYNAGIRSCSSSQACYGYYTYAAATAGTNPSSGAASYDICPANWRLPTQAEFNTLKNSYSTGAQLVSNWSAVYSGRYNSSSFSNGGSSGYYWSSTASGASLAYYLYFNSSSANVDDISKIYGFSIRCVAKS